MKKISVLIPCFNEEENIVPIAECVIKELENLSSYDYELIFIDNASTDNTRNQIKTVCNNNKKIKAIFNANNFGQFNSPYYGIQQTTGDCTILLCCDFQDPVELIPKMVEEWEKGYKVIIMQKTNSKENKLVYFFRSLYYKLINKFSTVDQIEHFTGFGLYDKSFINVLKELKDPKPFLRGIVAEYASNVKVIPYTQSERKNGRSHNNFFSLYDAAMISVTSYTKTGLRIATFVGGLVSIISLIIGLVYLILKLCFWDSFVAGMAPILIGMLFLGSIILLFLGLMGEYIMSINERIMNRPLVIEEDRINF